MIYDQEINKVLQDMPRDMERLYMRSLDSMSQASQGKTLSKAVLTWTTCATRPLKITELEVALRLDVNDHFPRLEESVLSLCGQFVTIDKLGKVQMSHETAREFLLNENLESDYSFRKEEAHTRISRTCLMYLIGDEMKPPRTSRRGAAAFSSRKRSNFCAYACSEFSFHLSKSSPVATDVFHLLVKFLRANVLSWLEMVTQTKNLNLIIRAASHLKKYLTTCMARLPPVAGDLQVIRDWPTDLVRVAAKFSDALLISPAAIYSLIIPFCPHGSTIYNAGNSLIDPFQDEVLVSFRANCQTLAASPDGRLLAGGVGSGIIHIYDFETLILLYRVESTNLYIKHLAFSPDSLRLADIRGTECNIWEPAILLGDSGGDDSSQATSNTVFETVATETRVKITALIVDVQKDAVFCSKSDGSVCLYNIRSGNEIRTLYRHKISVHALSWLPKAKFLLSIDVSNRILGWRLKKSPTEGWLPEEMLFQSRLDCGHAITQALASDVAGKFTLSTREADHLWSIGGHELDMRSYSSRPGIRKWLQHHDSEEHVICFEGATARIYTWSDWTEVATVEVNIDLGGLQIKNAFPCTSARKQRILLELSELDGPAKTCRLYLLGAKAFTVYNEGDKPDSPSAICAGQNDTLLENKLIHVDRTSNQCLMNRLATLSGYITHCIGATAASKIVFLDTHSWVCTADLDTPEDSKELYVRHFFVPYDWFSGSRHIISTVVSRDVLITRKSDLAVIKGGLEYTLPVESPEAVIEG
ncbi:hypothetical protein AtubIFM57258_002406 [Aspergillus tubingensis]|nr:hypothetical protein AtubIFM57258_002406 [Aspergillus tubingensis]